MPDARVIGVVGGIASGKSLVAQTLEKLGAIRLDADRWGHQALHDPIVRQTLVDRWGEQVVDGATGQIDRRQVAQRVFAGEDRAELDFLERTVHPKIGELLAAALAHAPRDRWLVLDAPLLLEAGWDRFCRWIVFVDAPQEVRLAHALERGWTAAEFARREDRQMPLALKRKHAHVAIPNHGTREQLTQRVTDWFQRLPPTPDTPMPDAPSPAE